MVSSRAVGYYIFQRGLGRHFERCKSPSVGIVAFPLGILKDRNTPTPYAAQHYHPTQLCAIQPKYITHGENDGHSKTSLTFPLMSSISCPTLSPSLRYGFSPLLITFSLSFRPKAMWSKFSGRGALALSALADFFTSINLFMLPRRNGKLKKKSYGTSTTHIRNSTFMFLALSFSDTWFRLS